MKNSIKRLNDPIIQVNDIFDELKQENKRLSNELLFANKCLDVLNKFKTYFYNNYVNNKCKCNQYLINSNENQLKDLENDFNSIINEKQLQNIDVESIKTEEQNTEIDESFETNHFESNDEMLPKKSRKLNFNQNPNNGLLRRKRKRKSGLSETEPTKRFCYFPGCHYEWINSMEFSKHLKVIHFFDKHNNEMRKCGICGRKVSKKGLKSHVVSVHTKSTLKPFKCTEKDCEFEFKSKRGLTLHLMKHKGMKNHVCDQPECSFRSLTYGQLLIHKRTHTGEKPYPCHWPGCDQRFGNQSGLIGHHKTVHTEERIFKCTFEGCKDAFKTRRILVLHTRRKHTGYRPHACDWPGCDYRAASVGDVTNHKYMHEGKRYKCTWKGCTAAYTARETFDTHVMQHKGVNRYACTWPECETFCLSAYNLKKHLMIHSGEKLVVCEWPHCDKRFVEKGNMKKHLRVHYK